MYARTPLPISTASKRSSQAETAKISHWSPFHMTRTRSILVWQELRRTTLHAKKAGADENMSRVLGAEESGYIVDPT